MTAFIVQSYYYNLDAMNWLLEKGANINKQDVLGNTALYYATFNCNYDEVEFLLSKKAKQLKNTNNMTPLEYAKSLITSETPNEYKAKINQIISKMDQVLLEADRVEKEKVEGEGLAEVNPEADRVAEANAKVNSEASTIDNANNQFTLTTEHIIKFNEEMNKNIIPTLVLIKAELNSIMLPNANSNDEDIVKYKENLNIFLDTYNYEFTQIFMVILQKVIKVINKIKPDDKSTNEKIKKLQTYENFVKHCDSIKKLLSDIRDKLYNNLKTSSNTEIDTNIREIINIITQPKSSGGFNATYKLKSKVGKLKKTKTSFTCKN
jgi:hypothetical protein